MSRTFINQTTQIANSNEYDDTLAATSALEFASGSASIHDDLNALRSMIQRVIGSGNWYDQPANSLAWLSSNKLNLSGGTMSGPLAMAGFKIADLGDPVDAQHAATKAYVDSQITSLDARSSKTFSVVTAAVLEGNNLFGGLGGNLDLALPTIPTDPAVFASTYDVYLNGQLLRPGVDMDVNPGTVSNSLKLTFDAVEGDVFCVIAYT